MSKKIVLSVLLAILFIFAVAFVVQAYQIQQVENPCECQRSISQEDEKSPVATTVYITRTGSKYHRSGCRYLKKSKIAIDKAEAIRRGYTACSVCEP